LACRYQTEWPSLLVAGFPLDFSCAQRLPCIEQTAAEFCLEYGPCPEGAKYRWEQTVCAADLSNSSTPSTFESMVVFELFHGASATREDRGLATRRMFAKLAPQVTENPIYMSVLFFLHLLLGGGMLPRFPPPSLGKSATSLIPATDHHHLHA